MRTYKKLHESKKVANIHIAKIKERGGNVKQFVQNGKILLEYSFPDEIHKEIVLKKAEKWANDLIKTKLGITPKYTIKWGDASNTFDNSIILRYKTPYHDKNPKEFYDTVLHEICHVIDNTFGSTSNKFGVGITRPISDSIEWRKIPLNTAPTTYAKDSKDEDFVISLQYALYDKINELTKDRQLFLINKFPKLS